MILKLRVPEYVGSVVKSGGWTYIDGIERVSTFGPIMGDDGEPRVFGSYDELKEYVAAAWGPPDLREYAYELWPNWPFRENGYARFVTIAVLFLEDDRWILAVLTEDCYLLGENGQTVDRLCASGAAFVK